MLGDVTIAEIGQSLSAAYCGRLLADVGARVLRLDPGPADRLTAADPDYAAYLHAGKQTGPAAAGREQGLAALVSEADVAVCDSAETVARLRGLRSGRARNLIVVCVSDYGLTGPDAGTRATDLTLQTEAGLAVMHVSRSSPPFVTGLPMSQLAGGLQAAIGVVQGLLARDAGGERVEVDVSRFESLVWLLTFPWAWAQVEGHVPYCVPIGAGLPFIPPMNTGPEFLRAKDGWVCLAANVPAQWASLKRIMRLPELDDPRFDQVASRAQYLDELAPLMQGFTARHTVAEVIELAQRQRVPVAPVATAESAYLLPPYSERGCTVTGAAGDFRQPTPPFRFTMAGAPARAPGASAEATPALPLRGLRVVAFELFHAGPLVTQYLAGLGADVVKVEAVNRPDLIRYAGIPGGTDQAWERGATFIALNVGKRAITADLDDPQGVAIVRRLLATADVVVDNFAPRTLDSRGLGYAGVREIRPDVVMTRMPGWGLTGSWAGRPGYTELAESASGSASLSGTDGAPHRTGTVFDPMSSGFSVFATLAALRHRHVTGEGAQAEIALCDSSLQFTAQAMIAASRGGPAAPPLGNRSPDVAPQGIYQCQDGEWAGLTISGDEEWAAMGRLPGADWAADARFETLSGRSHHHDELDELIGQWAAGRPAAELVRMLRAAGIAAAPLGIGPELIDHPQIIERGRVFRAPHPVVGELRFIGYPARMSTQPQLPDRTAAPTLGRDNAAVLTELGFGAGQIAELAATSAIGTVPYGRAGGPG